MTKIQQIQGILGVVQDDIWGPKTQNALELLLIEAGGHWVLASSFADPEDISAFKRCKAEGKTDQQCFSRGDNGVGKWGDPTTTDIPMCALPPEFWQPLGFSARGAKVKVFANKRTVICELRDTMPALKNIKNGAGIDLNHAAVSALGLKPPILIPANWRWI